jgi:hypothetical protein
LNIFQIDNRRKLLLPLETRTIRDRGPSRAACPALAGAGNKEIEIHSVSKKKYILYWVIREAKAEQKCAMKESLM